MILEKPVLVKFDVKNSMHRDAAKIFVLTSSWKHTPIRFEVDVGYTSVSSMIKEKMLDWYIEADSGNAYADYKDCCI